MRSGVVLLASVVALVVLSTASGSHTAISGVVFNPTAVAFADRLHGALAAGDAIKLTADGGRTWHVVRRTRRPVCELAVEGSAWYAQLDNGKALRSDDSGHRWAPTSDHLWPYCASGVNDSTLATPADPTWRLSVTGSGAGAQGKAVFRKLNGRWKRVACTNFSDSRFFCGRASYGGIGGYGYAEGIAGNVTGFGLIWEGRGFVYATRDGGRHWTAPMGKLDVSDVDFASWATVLSRGGVGFVLLHRYPQTRLLETTNAGRTWRVIHRWPESRLAPIRG